MLEKFFDSLYKFLALEEEEEEVKIVSPKKNRMGYAKGWGDLHSGKRDVDTYGHEELSSHVEGRKVKHWIWVYEADDAEGDEYVPVT